MDKRSTYIKKMNKNNTPFLWVVVDSSGSVVGRHRTRELAEKNIRYKGDMIMPYNKKYKWGEDYEIWD